MSELKSVYSLEEALILYDLIAMQHDVEAAMMAESRQKRGDP